MAMMIVILGVLCIVYAVTTSNRFKQLRIKIQEAQADIEVALIKRYDVLMQSLDAIKGFAEHEEKLMLNLIKARSGMTAAQMQGCVRIMTTSQWMGREVLDGFKKRDKEREEKIETENEVFNGQFGVAVSGDKIMIALCGGYYLFEPPRDYREIENISVERSKGEIAGMLLFARLLEDTVNGRGEIR